jgi:hypothetical protein
MALGNYTVFKAKQVDGFSFGSTAWSSTAMASTTYAMDSTFAQFNPAAILNIVGDADSNSPTKSYAWAKDFKVTGNEISMSQEPLLGNDTSNSQNVELGESVSSLMTVECMLVYRNNIPATIFTSTTKVALIQMDNSESTTTGKLNLAFNNIRVIHVGSLTRNAEGNMEQAIKFTCRGGEAGSTITVTQVSPAETWSKVPLGVDYIEEVRTA